MSPQEYPEQIYYMVVDEKSTGPFTLAEVILHPQLTPETLVWKPGIENWVAANTLPELSPAFTSQQRQQQVPPEYHSPNQENQSQFANNPQYHRDHTYQNRETHYERYGNFRSGYNRSNMRTNWLPWAIVATVLGFFTSCIGAIFGIIGIVQANKANNLYSQGYDREGDAANSNAKIMTIIGLIFAGIGIVAFFWFGSIFNSIGSFSNLSYL